MAAGLRTIVLAGLVVGGIDGFVLPDLKLADVLSVRDRLAGALGPNAEPLFDAIRRENIWRPVSYADPLGVEGKAAPAAAAASHPQALFVVPLLPSAGLSLGLQPV